MSTHSLSRGVVQYRAKGRISAEAALQHPYFKSLGERVHLLPDSKCCLNPPKWGQKGPPGTSLLPQRCFCSRSWWLWERGITIIIINNNLDGMRVGEEVPGGATLGQE